MKPEAKAVEPASYSISELAREFGITTRAIRFYEDKGLIAPARRGQTRIYSPEDRVRLKLILRGKRLGFSSTRAGQSSICTTRPTATWSSCSGCCCI
ncbi:MerR family transcriptional regulator [Microbulbifer taiwanensis]|uniref:MerR family transcriptional regulator n=1 Tax=Microbulbifer taiwanensis TaxID=986746 RepID=UPI0036101C09